MNTQTHESRKQKVEAEGRKCLLIAGDVSTQKFCERAVARTIKELGQIDILVNNAAFKIRTSAVRPLRPNRLNARLRGMPGGSFCIHRSQHSPASRSRLARGHPA